MNKAYLVFRHEFLRTVKRAGYIVMTLIVPVAGLAAIGVFTLVTPGSSMLSAESVGEVGTGMASVLVPGVFSLLLGLALMLGATSMVRGLAEEKESRLIEVLLSSVSIRQLLIGKVFALGTAGLLQVLVWLISTPFILGLASSSFGGFMSAVQIPANFLLLGVIYFILGYLLFAVFSIGLGAVSSNVTVGSQLSMVYTLTSFVPLWFMALLLFFPESPLWVVLTIFPVTAPVQTMLRLGVSSVPSWQIITSIGVLAISIVSGMILSIRVFRTHMLATGKKQGASETA
jgi:ABC-2 type transport system permease protein